MIRHATFVVVVVAALFAVDLSAQCNWTGITEACGTVGIGTTTPSGGVAVHITGAFGSSTYAMMDRSSANADGGYLFRTQNSVFTEWFVGKLGAQNNEGLYFAYSNTLTPMLSIDTSGNVTVAGNLAAKYQDVAEWVPSADDYPSGTVVVLDRERSNHVTISTTAFDTAVAGVVSAKPGLLLGERGSGKAVVATTGRVRVKVDATKHPIAIGDLLVTSDRPGYAMLSEPLTIGGRRMHQPGTILGKALEPLAKGEGEVLVLLSLQ